MSDNELKITSEYLHSLKPGFLPKEIFNQVTRLTVTPIVEIVPVRVTDGTIQVLLLKRPADDPNWPNMWHTPGTVLLSSDKEATFDDAFNRVLHNELNDIQIKRGPTFVSYLFHKVARGSELALIHWIEIEETLVGEFKEVENCLDIVIDTQREFILEAVNDFRKHTQTSQITSI